MDGVVVPGPEADWEPAPQYQGGKRNPALQVSLFEHLGAVFRPVAGLSPSLEALAQRLRLVVEESWDDLGPVQIATFSIQATDFALWRDVNSPCQDTFVGVSRSCPDEESALGLLLNVLGIGADALTFRCDEEQGFHDVRSGR